MEVPSEHWKWFNWKDFFASNLFCPRWIFVWDFESLHILRRLIWRQQVPNIHQHESWRKEIKISWIRILKDTHCLTVFSWYSIPIFSGKVTYNLMPFTWACPSYIWILWINLVSHFVIRVLLENHRLTKLHLLIILKLIIIWKP